MKDQWMEFFVVYENERTKKVHIHIRKGRDESEGFQLAAAAAKKAYDVAPIHMIQFVRAAESIEELTGKEKN